MLYIYIYFFLITRRYSVFSYDSFKERKMLYINNFFFCLVTRGYSVFSNTICNFHAMFSLH